MTHKTRLRGIISPARTIVSATLLLSLFPCLAKGQVDMEINKSVWKQKYGVLDSQLNNPDWRAQDADGDGVRNGDEFIAGTNPFKKSASDPHFRPPLVSDGENALSLEFPTVPGKFYQAEASDTLADAWLSGSLPNLAGDGGRRTLTVPKRAGHFFRIKVSDRSTPGDQVSDWAKTMLGFSPTASLASQTSYDHTSLAASLETQNLIGITTVNGSTVQPPDATTAASDFALIRITRSGFIIPGAITVPIAKSGTAIEGTDYAALPDSVTIPAGVNSLDLRITPRFNASRLSSASVIVTVKPADATGAAGNYRLGNPVLAGVTILPSGDPDGTGLTGNYYNGASSTYASPLNFGGVATTYSYTKLTTTTGTAVITYTGTPASPITVGSQVSMQFTSGKLFVTPYSGVATYPVIAPVTANSFTIAINSAAVPATGTGASVLGNFSKPVTNLDAGIDFQYNYGTPGGNTYIDADNYSVRWEGYLSPTTAGNYTFQLDADDKARVLLDTGTGLTPILENGWDTAATGAFKASAAIPLAVPASASARYRIVVEFVETTGAAKCKLQWKLNSAAYANIPSTNVFVNTTDATAGWTANYYGNTTFATPAARTQVDAAITAVNNGDWGTGTPDPAIYHNNFTIRWTGQILPQYSQKYYFVFRSDDGAKVWVNDQLIINRWPGGTAADSTGSIDLQANVAYDIQIEYYEGTGSAEAHLSWYSEDQAKQIVPANRLFPTISGATPLAGDPPAAPPAITSPTRGIAILGADAPFSMMLTSSNSGAISASGLPAWLTLVNGVLSGTPPAAGIYQFTVNTTNDAGMGSTVITIEVQAAAGQLTRDLWTTGVGGPLLSDVPWQSAPGTTDSISAAEDNTTTYGTNTGERLRGYFIAPATGNYYFWIAASNNAQLWISNNNEPVNKVLRASVSGSTGTASRVWSAQPSQKSPWLSLVAGRKYYIEALHNTGSSGSANNLAIGWFLDPTGSTASPITDGSGVLPSFVISPWDNPPTTTVPGTLYVTNLQGVEGLGNITATGGAFLRVSGSSAVLQLNYAGLTSGVTSRKIYNAADQMLFDVDAQERNYPALKTTDGGYTWNLSGNDLSALNNGEVHLRIATLSHPDGEITGTFGKIAGSQAAPAIPAYPAWADLHASSDAQNSRFLSQATFGPSPADLAAVKSLGYRAWIENQFALTPTRNVPYILANLSSDPQNAYPSTLMFNSWWKNSVTAPDQLRQRAAFALSEIFVVSDTGPLNNNGRVLADYYDSLVDSAFGNFRDILKQVTLAPAMGVYLDMRGNTLGNIANGTHPNENYAREILQLFSAGLYRRWPDGTLVLDSTGSAVPTYDQSVITGFARVFTGWNWGQPLASGRLPTATPNSNYFDPMVLMPAKHELGSKILLDNVVLPPATVVTATDTSTDPTSTYTVQTTDPALGAGNVVTTTITNRYDLNGVKDLDQTFDNIVNNSAVAPYICRQLIQRLVTSSPKPEYVSRVVRAFNGERNVDGVATGVKGDMKEVFRAILLDYEARSADAAADITFGKQREPLLRITGPARSFPPPSFPNSTYRQLGSLPILVTTPAPHRLGTETVLLSSFTDSGSASANLPPAQAYATANTTPAYNFVGSTGIVTITAPAYQAGDVVAIQFTSGNLGTNATYKLVQNYTVATATATNFTLNLGTVTGIASGTGNCLTPNNFTVNNSGVITPAYTSTGATVTITSSGFAAGQKLYVKFSSGGLLGAGFDGVYTIATATSTNFTVTLAAAPANANGTTLIPRLAGGYTVTTSGSTSAIALQVSGNHNLRIGDQVQLDFLVTNAGIPAQDGLYTVDGIKGPNVFTVTTSTAITNGNQSSNGMVAFPLSISSWNRSGTLTVGLGTWNVSTSQNDLTQTPLNSATVFNFFYPDYQYPGAMAQAGMTTPEFQLTNDSTIMNLTNAITGSILSATNTSGYTSYKTGGGAVVSDLGPYMTEPQTNNAGIPTLVDQLSTLLIGGNLSSGGRGTIIGYVANTTNFPMSSPPTNTQMRDRVRAIVHLIVTSAEYAIQK